MVDRRHGLSFALLALLVLGLQIAVPGHLSGQDLSAPRKQLIEKVEGQAQKDVDLDKPLYGLSDLEKLFGEEATVVGLPLAELLATYEAAYEKARTDKPWWKKLEPSSGWVFGGIVATLTILWGLFQKTLERFFAWLGQGLYGFITRFRLFWWLAERKYRQALVRSYQELKIPFRPGRPLPMAEVFVPLRVNAVGNTELVDAQTALSQHRRLVVVGDPGAGKTMLMRHLSLSFAREGLLDFQDGLVPILVELHRLNEPGQDLTQHLSQALEQMDFPNAAGFVASRLSRGNLLLLLDGLDEVNRDSRNRVVSQIKDLAQKAPECRVVITCRTAVYNDEFAGWSDQNLKVVDFDDQQIQRFLSGWTSQMPPGKSVEHLLTSLSERPRILALARNPLLLTIIAYLYCDTPFVLPHSRAEFYRTATNLLLDRWDRFHLRQNQYRVSHKEFVLQALALFFQDRASQEQQDPRSAPLQDVLRVIKEVLPRLNLDVEQAEPLLDEIVTRSSLLLALDGGKRFQFSHLTIQEFFAAMGLETRATDLVSSFGKNPDLWRETVKLWCGLDHDSTAFLREVEAIAPLTALECLGDTQKVEADYATALIESFRGRLGQEGADADAIRRALALVAADFRPRGLRLREVLISSLENLETLPTTRLAVAQVLSLTNLPQAAEALTARSGVDPDLRVHVVEMGDLAVSPLTDLAVKDNGGEGWSIEALTAIGTPRAARALAELLWSGVSEVERLAAWHLATLLPRPEVEAALGMLALKPEQKKAGPFDWIWEPFDADPASSLRLVAGRIAALIQNTPANQIPSRRLAIDPRLSIPFCTVVAQKTQSKVATFYGIDLTRVRFEREADELSTHPIWQYLLGSMSFEQQFSVTQLTKTDPRPTKEDWRHIYRPTNYTFNSSLQMSGLGASVIALALLGLFSLAQGVAATRYDLSWPAVSLFAVLLAAQPILIIGTQAQHNITRLPDNAAFFSLLALPSIVITILTLRAGNSSWSTGLIVFFLGSISVKLMVKVRLDEPLFVIGWWIVVGATLGGMVELIPPNALLTLEGSTLVLGTCYVATALLFLTTFFVDLFRYWRTGRLYTTAFDLKNALISSGTYALSPFLSWPLLAGILWPSLQIHESFGWLGLIIFWTGWLLAVGGFIAVAARKERRAQNPLHGLLDDELKPKAKGPVRSFPLKLFASWPFAGRNRFL